MTDAAAFIAAICADPSDDAPRLQYADWLDENGQGERAEFIRVQCRYAVLFPRYTSGRLSASEEIEAEQLSGLLLSKFRVPLNGPLAWAKDDPYQICQLDSLPINAPRIEWDWYRGFVTSLRMNWSDCERHLDKILEAHPVEKIEITTPIDWAHRDGWIYLYEGLPPAPGLTKGRRMKNTFPQTEGVGDVATQRTYIQGILMREWPGIEFTVPYVDMLAGPTAYVEFAQNQIAIVARSLGLPPHLVR
jgi:uncharacterized protein (TIGR02996 family)